MTVGDVIGLLREAMNLTLVVSAPLLIIALAVGLIIGLFQAATQVNEMTLSFIPKLLAMGAVLLVAGGWMLERLVSFTRQLIMDLPNLVG
ncbi:MAG: flagellar biosynthesis protein FliQ [Oceanococcaceae bacterium]